MASKVIMPQGGQDLTTGRVVRWLKKVGDPVKKGEVICEVETEKAVFEVSAPQDGVLLQITARDGEEVEILSTIGFVGDKSESINKTESQAPADLPKAESAVLPEIKEIGQHKIEPKIIISPKARKLARDNALPLGSLVSSRQDGKITTEDVMKKLGAAAPQGTAKVLADKSDRTVTTRQGKEDHCKTPVAKLVKRPAYFCHCSS